MGAASLKLVRLSEGAHVNRLAHTFLEAITGAESWPTALTRMADSFHGIEAYFTVWDRAHSKALFSACVGRFSPEAIERYARYIPSGNSCRDALIRSQRGEVILTQNHYGDALPRTELYNELLRPLGARYVMGVKIADSGAKMSMLRIHRSVSNGPYSDEDVRKVNCLFPSLSHAAQLHFNRLRVAQMEGVATAALHHLQVAVIVIDHDRSILQLNALAESILANDTVLMVRENRLSFGNLDADAKLQHSIDRAWGSHGTVCQPSVVEYRCTGAGNYEVSIAPFRSRDFLGGISEAVLLTLKRVDRKLEGVVDKLRTEFGLTRTEAAVAEQITQGRTLQQVAAHNSLSLNTVKTHLKAVFAKMHVHSQSDLVRIVLGRHSTNS
jgi:DNA-binding CsgD family transcriptional regulator